MQVEHDSGNNRFVVHTGGEDAELAYAVLEDGALDLLHTYVPPEARDQGIADALAHEAFAHVRAEGKKVVASCAFVRAWLRRHPEERDVVR
jgi:predicted GNAT family acetyltransferase